MGGTLATDQVTAARQVLGRQLRALREAAGYTQQELADLLGYSRPRVAGAEKGEGCALLFWRGCDKTLNAGGTLVAGFQDIEALRRREALEAAAAARAERAARVHGDWPITRDLSMDGEIAEFSGRSHKFIAAYVSSDAVQRIVEHGSAKPAPGQWIECYTADTGHSGGDCSLYLWPFGIAVFHLVEPLAMPSIARLAIWRVRSYDENLAWATSHLRQLTREDTASASYVLSVYWIDSHDWHIEQLDTALRIICSPRVLLRRELGEASSQCGQAEMVERSLLAGGFENGDIRAFGLSGVSLGFASWSGVVYHPVSPEQCLTENDFVRCELAVQAIWAYCQYVTDQVETGSDPVVPSQYGWRFLRGARSRLLNPRPLETGQHSAMRSSIIDTSGLASRLDQAMEILYQTERP